MDSDNIVIKISYSYSYAFLFNNKGSTLPILSVIIVTSLLPIFAGILTNFNYLYNIPSLNLKTVSLFSSLTLNLSWPINDSI